MSKGGTTSAGSATEIPQWVQDAGRKQYQTGTELGQIGYTPYYGADVAAFNPMQESAFRSTGTAADAFGMGPASTVPSGATFGPHSPTWATDGIPTAQTFAGNMRGYSGMPMYTQALNTLEEQRPFQKQQLEQQFIDPTTGLTPEGRKIQDINSLYNEAFNRNVGLEGVSTYLPLMQQGMTNNELRKILYESDEGKALGKSSLNAPIQIGVGGGLLGGEQYVPPALSSGSSGILDSITGTGSTVVDSGSTVVDTVVDSGSTVVDTVVDGLLSTVDDVASGQQMIGDTLTDTDLSTSTPSTFDLYGSQIDQLMPIYQQELGRSLQDPVALAYYGEELKSGRMTPEQVRANISGSIEGKQYDAAQQAAAQNSANLGFGTSSTTGNAADDEAQLAAYNKFISDNNDVRLTGLTNRGPGGEFTLADYENDLTNVFTGVSGYLERFATEMTKVLDNSLVGKIANTLEGDKTADAIAYATNESKEDVNLALEILSKGNEVVQAAFKLTPFGQVVSSLIASLPAGGLVSSSTTDSSYITGNNDNSVTVTPLNNTYQTNVTDVNNAIDFAGGLTGGGL